MHLGEFGAARHELSGEKDDFLFCGEEFLVQCKMPAVLMLQLGASVSGKIDETEGFAAIWEALRVSLTIPEVRRRAEPDDQPEDVGEDGMVIISEADDEPFRRLYKLAIDNGVELEGMMRLVMGLFEAQSGRPTRPVPVSSDGRSITSQSSSTSSIHPALSHLRPVEDLVAQSAITPTPVGQIRMGDGQMADVEYDQRPTSEQAG